MGNKKGSNKREKKTPEQAGIRTPQTRSKTNTRKPEGRACMDDLGMSLAKLGLRIRKVTADGNCFFRACSDQLFGGEQSHVDLRHEVVSFMQSHESDFSPYIEDDESFPSYCKRMNKDGCWAGQQEQVALTRLKGLKICVHQDGQPSWTIAPDYPEIKQDAKTIHLSYHDGEHYNSVRLISDLGGQPATPIVWQSDTGSQDKDIGNETRDTRSRARWKAEARQSNTKDTAASQEKFNDKIPFSAPNEDHRDAELAETNLADGLQIPMNSSGNLGQCEHKIETENPKPKLQADETLKRNIINANSKQTKRPTRNGNCPCGSKRKYKNCCLPAKQASARNIDQAAQLQGDVIQTLQIETIFV